MVPIKFSSAIGFTLLFSVATAAETQLIHPVMAQIVSQVVAQAPTFKLPNSVPKETKIRIDGSSSMVAVNRVLKQRFEQRYPGSQINLANNGTIAGLRAVLNGQADLAAIGRPLTVQEKAQGLVAVPIGRDKIAILAGANNPFAKSLTIAQFAKIFRGEIKNWSEVGGPSVPIRFVDRPDSSDTRQALQNYPVFKQAKFATGSTAEKLKEDTTEAVLQKLGKDGISYSTANQIKNQPGVKAIAMHGKSPSDPRYPFSQALYYVYKGAPSAAVQSFLGYGTATVGQKAIAQAGVADAVPPELRAAQNSSAGAKTTANPAKAQKATTAGTPKNVPTAAKSATKSAAKSSSLNAQVATAPDNGSGSGIPNWLWWLFPIGAGAALFGFLRKGRRGTQASPVFEQDQEQFILPSRTAEGEGFTGGSEAASSWATGLEPSLPHEEFGGNSPTFPTETEFAGDSARTARDRLSDLTDSTPDFAGNPPPATPTAPTAPTESALAEATAEVEADHLSGLDLSRLDLPGDTLEMGGAVAGGALTAGAGAVGWSALRSRTSQSRVVLKARNSEEVEAFWDIHPEDQKVLRRQGGEKLAIRLFDVTAIDLDHQPPHNVQQFDCDELSLRQRLPVATSDRDYLAEIGYLTPDGDWFAVARSTHVRVPPAANFAGDIPPMDGAGDPERAFLANDRDSIESPPWNVETNQPPHLTDNATQVGGAVVGGAGATAWAFLSGHRNGLHRNGGANDVAEQTPDVTTTNPTEAISVSRNSEGIASQASGEIASEPFVSLGRLVLTPRNSQWAYAYWDIPRMQRAKLDRFAAGNLVLRLYDVTDLDPELQMPDQFEQFAVDDMALSCDVPIPEGSRTYLAEIGYVNANDSWTRLARSAPVWVSAS